MGAYLADPHTSSDEIEEIRQEYMRHGNCPPEVLEHELSRLQANQQFIYKACLPAYQLFLSLNTQWLRAPTGQKLGLNYTSVESLLNLHNITKPEQRKQRFFELQLLESGYLKQLSKRQQSGK